jgi:hypothetical protein
MWILIPQRLLTTLRRMALLNNRPIKQQAEFLLWQAIAAAEADTQTAWDALALHEQEVVHAKTD